MEKLLIICGPTASGKTSLAIKLAKKYNGELINADSRQLYEGMGIVTGKDLPQNAISTVVGHISYRGRKFSIKTYELEGVPIWLYDLLPIDVPVSISIYQQATHIAINHIRKKGKLPILVGGSGLYIRSIVDNIETIDIPQNESLRSKLKDVSVGDLQDRLRQIDNAKFESMNHSDSANPRRLLRAIEVAQYKHAGGNSHSHNDKFILDPLWIGLYRHDKEIKNAISERVESRWRNGAIDEVRNVFIGNSSANIISSLGVGPVQLFIEGKCLENEAKAMWTKEEMAYVKRQMVWFKKNTKIVWFDAALNTLYDQVEKCVSPWYTKS